jgi:Phosphate-induced protein 1 conserved region
MRSVTIATLAVSCLAAAIATSAVAGSVRPPAPGEDLVPTGKGWGERPAPGTDNASVTGQLRAARPKNTSNGINYHGGPLLIGGPNVYYIWYGNWSGNTATGILTNLAGSIGGSGYFNINTTYYDGSNAHVKNVVTYSGSKTDSYSQGAALSDAQVQTVVSSAISSGALPKDPNAVYFVLTSSDVNETSGFCTQYCGWHAHASIGGTDIKYSFVGNPDRCPSACEAQTTSPNGNPGADGMASIIAHELEEATTDPDLNAWYDTRGYENADKCAWTFGTESTASNGSKYNLTLGTTKFLIQQNWVNASGGYCSMSY